MGLLWPSPQILRPDWKGFPRTNPLAYWASLSATKKKNFITWGTSCSGLWLRFSSQGGVVDLEALRVDDPDVGRNAIAELDLDDVAHGQLLRLDRLLLAVPYAECVLGPML